MLCDLLLILFVCAFITKVTPAPGPYKIKSAMLNKFIASCLTSRPEIVLPQAKFWTYTDRFGKVHMELK